MILQPAETTATTCALCGAPSVEEQFLGLPALARCRRCGFAWTHQYSTANSVAPYEGDYFTEGSSYDGGYFHRAVQWQFEARRRVEWLLKYAGEIETLLEVGCGGGFFLQAANHFGIRAQGVEPSRDGAAWAVNKLGMNVTMSTFEKANISGSFDAVCAFHVLEHIADPWRFVRDVRRLLRPRGWLVLEVPNVASARARRKGASWSGLQPGYHLWHFTPTTLQTMLEQNGFTPVCCETIFGRHYVRSAHAFGRSTLSFLRELVEDWRATGSLRTTHEIAGDYVRVLARR